MRTPLALCLRSSAIGFQIATVDDGCRIVLAEQASGER